MPVQPIPKKNYLKVESVDAITSPRVLAFYDYWRSRQKGDALPVWSDIDLMEIYTLAPFIAVKDVIDGGQDFYNRYWGTGLGDAYGFDATGLKFSDYLEPDAVSEGLALHRAIVETARPMKSSGTMEFWRSRDYIRFEGVICPIKGSDGGVGMLISFYDINLEGRQA